MVMVFSSHRTCVVVVALEGSKISVDWVNAQSASASVEVTSLHCRRWPAREAAPDQTTSGLARLAEQAVAIARSSSGLWYLSRVLPAGPVYHLGHRHSYTKRQSVGKYALVVD